MLDLSRGIKKITDNLKHERASRESTELIPFGIKYLDDALNGIRKDDFVLLGAGTGLGKTQIATNIARAVANTGLEVTFFALEAAKYEIERRIKYQFLAKAFYETYNQFNRPFDLNYMDWYDGKLKDPILDMAEEQLEQLYDTNFQNLNVKYRSGHYDVREFETDLLSIQDKTKLIIIDHLHYFDFEGENENREFKLIMKKISDMAQIKQIPIIMVAHLRKRSKDSGIIPDINDFHGTSDIVKIPTKIVTLGACKEDLLRSFHERRWPTFIRIVKCRTDASRTKFPAVMVFNGNTNTYESDYYLGKLSDDENEFIRFMISPSRMEIPSWAKGAK